LKHYRLGLKPVVTQPRLRLADYLRPSDLPDVGSLKYPFGHADAIQPHMFCNDSVGDCAIAGSIEEVRLANALAGKTVNFTDATAIENYSAITGYVPGDPSTDQGTDVHELYDYRKATGIIDADGQRHKILAYAGLTPGDFDEALIALSLFPSGVGIGIQVADFCEDQFDAGQPWHPEPGYHAIEGGHYVPLVGATDRHTGLLYTWGAVQGITAPFYAEYNTVAAVALTAEMFVDGKSPTGLDMARLRADLGLLDTGPVMGRKAKKGNEK